jgi:hypothetical protein
VEGKRVNLNQARSILEEARRDLHAAYSAQGQAHGQVAKARDKVNSVLGAGIQMAGLKETQGWLAGLDDATNQLLPKIQAASEKIGHASGS